MPIDIFDSYHLTAIAEEVVPPPPFSRTDIFPPVQMIFLHPKKF